MSLNDDEKLDNTAHRERVRPTVLIPIALFMLSVAAVINANANPARPQEISYAYNSTENEKFYLGEPNATLLNCKKVINPESKFSRCKKMELLSTYTEHYDYFSCLEKDTKTEYLLFNTLQACQADLDAMKKSYRKNLEGSYGYTAKSSDCVLITQNTAKSFRKCVATNPVTLKADNGVNVHLCRTKDDVPYAVFDTKKTCDIAKMKCANFLSKYTCNVITYTLGE